MSMLFMLIPTFFNMRKEMFRKTFPILLFSSFFIIHKCIAAPIKTTPITLTFTYAMFYMDGISSIKGQGYCVSGTVASSPTTNTHFTSKFGSDGTLVATEYHNTISYSKSSYPFIHNVMYVSGKCLSFEEDDTSIETSNNARLKFYNGIDASADPGLALTYPIVVYKGIALADGRYALVGDTAATATTFVMLVTQYVSNALVHNEDMNTSPKIKYRSITQITDGSLLVLGYSYDSVLPNGFYFIPYSLGLIQGTRVPLDIANANGYYVDIITLSDGNCAIAGGDIVSSQNRGFIAKFNTIGTKLWHIGSVVTAAYCFTSIMQRSDGTIIAGGYKDASGYTAPWLLSVSSTDGSTNWEVTYPESNANFYAVSIAETDDYSFTIVGLKIDNLGKSAYVLKVITSCQTGYIVNSAGNDCVLPCTAGQAYISGSCQTCLAGTYSLAGASSCTPCNAGYYQNQAGQSTCIACPSPTISTSSGSSSCTPCAAGTFYISASSSCSPCSAGYFSPAGSLSCTACTAGYFSAGASGSCTACNAGYFSAGASSSCSSCSAGYYSPAASGSCTPCNAGYYSPAVSGSCTPCNAGYFSAGASSSCSSCSAGFFSPATSSSCSPCSAGYFSLGGSGSCSPCSAGYYQDQTGQSTCNTCPILTSSTSGSVSCTPCPAGTYYIAASYSCSPCSAGYYQDLTGQLTCKTCPILTSSSSGSASCTPCPVGTYYIAASYSCSACNVGYYQDQIGQSTCKICPILTIAASSGSTSCTPCPTGYYQCSVGMSTCNVCPNNNCGPCKLVNRSMCVQYNGICWTNYEDRCASVSITDNCINKIAKVCYKIWMANGTNDPQCIDYASYLNFTLMQVKPNLISAIYSSDGQNISLTFDQAIYQVGFTDASSVFNSDTLKWLPSSRSAQWTSQNVLNVAYSPESGIMTKLTLLENAIYINYPYAQVAASAVDFPVS